MGPSPSIPSQSVIRLCPFLLSQPLRCEPTKHSAWTQLALTIRLVLTGRGRRMRRCCAALLRVMSDTDISRRASARPAPRFPARGLRKARCVVAGLAPARRCARCLGSPARSAACRPWTVCAARTRCSWIGPTRSGPTRPWQRSRTGMAWAAGREGPHAGSPGRTGALAAWRRRCTGAACPRCSAGSVPSCPPQRGARAREGARAGSAFCIHPCCHRRLYAQTAFTDDGSCRRIQRQRAQMTVYAGVYEAA